MNCSLLYVRVSSQYVCIADTPSGDRLARRTAPLLKTCQIQEDMLRTICSFLTLRRTGYGRCMFEAKSHCCCGHFLKHPYSAGRKDDVLVLGTGMWHAWGAPRPWLTSL